MHSVTSNAVARELNTVVTYSIPNAGIKILRVGKVCNAYYGGNLNGYPSGFAYSGVIPQEIRPTNLNIRAILLNNTLDQSIGQVAIRSNGDVQFYQYGGGTFGNYEYQAWWTWIID